MLCNGPTFGRIRLLLIRQASQIIHAGLQCQRNAPALFKGHVALAALDFGIITLVDARQHLHLDLGIAPLFSEHFHRCHIHYPRKLCPIDLSKIG